jgi:predicted ArsR family transcriptional regulator
MTEIQRRILQVLASFFENHPNSGTGDTEMAEALKIHVQEARHHMQELSNQGYIKLQDASSLSGKRLITDGITPKGFMVVNR